MCAGHDNCEWWEHIDWNVDPKSGFAGGACTLKKCMPGKMGGSWNNIPTISMVNGPKDCAKNGSLTCEADYCTKSQVAYMGDDLYSPISYGWDEPYPMQKCMAKCDNDDSCKAWTFTGYPEYEEPWQCYLKSGTGDQPSRNLPTSTSGPTHSLCSKCATMEVSGLETTGNVSYEGSDDKTLYQSTINNCYSSQELTGSFKQSKEVTVTETHTYSMTKSVSQTFERNTTDSLVINFSAGINFFVDINFNMRKEVTSTQSWSKKTTNTATDVDTTTESEVTAVEAGFTYTVPAGKKVTIASSMKRMKGSVPWQAVAQCKDKNGVVLETQQVTGSYTGYAMTSSEVMVRGDEC